ncbi:MAG TPA: YcaO-like family protein [Nitrospiraceae bacterium]|jgi:ribosomal protein S12 methylthiotransferase accessory factor|nr:YcaO-like family protein [Nitrospiraceae bacterium]
MDVPTLLKKRTEKRYWNGTHRAIAPAETVAHLTPHLKRFGITRVANVTGLDWLGIPVVMVCRPNAKSLSVSQGKGLTLDAARASGIMESLELHHAERIDNPVKLGSHEEFSNSHSVVDTAQFPFLMTNGYHPQKELLWIEGYDVIQEKTTWVPYEYVSANASNHRCQGDGSFILGSNGLASGNNLLEAITHGACEIVERDAMTLWRYSNSEMRDSRALDLRSCDDSTCKGLLERCHEAGIHVYAWELTSDIGIPCFLCLLCEDSRSSNRGRYSSAGMGCHTSKSIALMRAIVEAAQTRLTMISGSRDDIFRDEYNQSRAEPDDLSRFRALLRSKSKLRSFSDIPSSERETFNDDLDLLMQRLRFIGIQNFIVVRLMEPNSSFQIVKVIIPGLEGSSHLPGYCPGQRVQVQQGNFL